MIFSPTLAKGISCTEPETGSGSFFGCFDLIARALLGLIRGASVKRQTSGARQPREARHVVRPVEE